MNQERNDIYHGKIEILGKPNTNAIVLTPADIHVKLDGKEIPHVQRIELIIDARGGLPKIVLTMIPTELVIDLDDIEVHEE